MIDDEEDGEGKQGNSRNSDESVFLCNVGRGGDQRLHCLAGEKDL